MMKTALSPIALAVAALVGGLAAMLAAGIWSLIATMAGGQNATLPLGIALIAGLLTPLGAGGVVGTMVVAFAINHRGNGFFIFRPGEGWEYVMVLGLCALPLGAIGAGRWSLDHALGITDELDGWLGLGLSAGLGVVGAVVVLVTSWRPPPTTGGGE